MVDSTQINQNQTPGDKIAVDAIVDGDGETIKHQRVKLQTGVDGVATDVSATNPAPTLLHGTTHPGTVVPITTNREGSVDVHHGTSVSAFGDQIAVNPIPAFQLMFPYSVDTANVIQFNTAGASITSANSQAILRTGTGIGGTALLQSKDFLIYKPGFGATCRFSMGVTTAGTTVGTVQQAGLGSAEDAFTFAYQNGDMSIRSLQNGAQNQWELTITTGASSASNVTITLNDVVFTVAVTDSSSSGNFTASEIAADPQFLPDFFVHADGNAITFQSSRTGTRAGAFSFSPGSTGAVGTGTQTVVGRASTVIDIPRTDWNIDQCDGTGPQMPLIDWSMGNVYQIRYQWLGYGAQSYFVENPLSGNMVLVHRVLYANQNLIPSVFNPSLQFLAINTNTFTALDVSMFIGSAAGLVDGGTSTLIGHKNAAFYSGTAPNANFGNIVSFCAPLNFKSKTNRTEVSIVRISLTAAAAANIQITKDAVLGGTAVWTSIGTDILLVSDQASTTVTGGTVAWADRAEKQDRFPMEPGGSGYRELVKVYPGEVVTIAAQADSGTSAITVAVNWIEPI